MHDEPIRTDLVKSMQKSISGLSYWRCIFWAAGNKLGVLMRPALLKPDLYPWKVREFWSLDFQKTQRKHNSSSTFSQWEIQEVATWKALKLIKGEQKSFLKTWKVYDLSSLLINVRSRQLWYHSIRRNEDHSIRRNEISKTHMNYMHHMTHTHIRGKLFEICLAILRK